jgi:DTW domain-containing protein YfiP
MRRCYTTAVDDPRCHGCWLLEPLCLCADLRAVRARLQVRTRVVVVRHVSEINRRSNTGRLVAAAIPGATLVDWGTLSTASQAAVHATLSSLGPSPAVLYPEGRTHAVRPDTLVILDGTWPQARRMLQRLPGMATVPRLALPPPAQAGPRLRRGARPEQMSTLEATAAAMAHLEGPEVAAELEALLAAFVDRATPVTQRRD